MPLMATRLMLSLKRAARSPDSVWSLNSAAPSETLRFAHHTIGGTDRGDDGIALKHLSSKGKALHPQSDDQRS